MSDIKSSAPTMINIESLEDSKATIIPIDDGMTEKEQAGVFLTWLIIGLMFIFITGILIIFSVGEFHFQNLINTTISSLSDDKLTAELIFFRGKARYF